VSKLFRRFANENELSDTALCGAIRELSAGLIHANLGGGVYKQRIARAGQGKSGGFRTVIFFRAGQRAIFILGFAKNARTAWIGRNWRD
jgi:hypothetical protein